MNNKNVKVTQRKTTDNRPKKVPSSRSKNISQPNVKKVEKKEAEPKAAAPKATEPKGKKEPHIAVNRDVLRESKEIAQGSLEPMGDKSVPEEMATAAAPSAEVSKEIPAAESPKPIPEETERPVVAAPAEKKAEQPTAAVSAEKKVKRPALIDLSEKSMAFRKIVDLALAFERLEGAQKKLKAQIAVQDEKIARLGEERDSLKQNLEAAELLCMKKQKEIEELQAELEHRNEVIQIVKADKVKSSEEFKNSLAAALQIYKQDCKELKELDMSVDVGEAVLETLEDVFKTLQKKGIEI